MFQSETIDEGVPWRRKTSVENRVARSGAVKCVGKSIKWTNLLKKSQMTQITMCLKDAGR